MNAVFIVNPLAGGGKAWSELFHGLPLEGEVRLTNGPGHATELAREALKEGKRSIVAVGGDGTLNEVVNGFFENGKIIDPEAELGIVGIGTGCDTIKSFRIPRDPRRALLALSAIPGYRARPVDVGRVRFLDHEGKESIRYFINIAEAGIGGAVVGAVNKTSKKWGGFSTFLLGTLETIFRYQNRLLELQLDDLPARHLVASNVVVGNGRYFGGGMKILPHAEFDDRLLEILVMGDLSPTELLLNLGGVYFGTHVNHPLVETHQARRVRVSSTLPLPIDVDGEQPGTTPAEFEILPHALRVRLP